MDGSSQCNTGLLLDYRSPAKWLALNGEFDRSASKFLSADKPKRMRELESAVDSTVRDGSTSVQDSGDESTSMEDSRDRTNKHTEYCSCQ